MGFLGRGRGGNRGKSRGGGIHASTHKSKEHDKSKSSSNSGTRGRDGSSRGSGGSNNPSESTSNKFDSKDFSKESLRITVGNEMYQERNRSSNSPLSERLGPPVDSSGSHSKKQDIRYDDTDLYKQEAKFYGDRQRDRPREDHRGGSYERDSRNRLSHKSDDRYRDDRGKRTDSYRGHDRGSRDKRDTSRNDSRDYPDRHKERGRDNGSYETRDRRDSRERSSERNRGLYRDSPGQRHYDVNPEHGRQGGDLPPVNIPPAPKPLKSILKKSNPASAPNEPAPHITGVYSTPNTNVNIETVGGIFPVQGRQGFPSVENRLGPHRQPSMGRGSDDVQGRPQKSGLPGMSSYMDIEDEEKFLYGDDDKHDSEIHDRFSSSYQSGGYPETDRQQPLQHQQQQQRQQHIPSIPSEPQPDLSALRSGALDSQLAGFRGGGLESQLAALRASGLETQLAALRSSGLENQISALRSSGLDLQLSSLRSGLLPDDRRDIYPNQPMQQDLYGRPQESAMNPQAPVHQQEPNYSTDLLSLFTNKPQPSTQSSQPTYLSSTQEEKPKPAYDPTIENILKSIGFDFEMSKRMQEKAQKPKEEEVFGINEGATFLEGGLSEDIKKKLFKEKEESMVDEFLREMKSRPVHSDPERREHRYEKDSERKYDTRDTNRKFDREFDRGDDRKYDRDMNIRYERSRSRSLELYHDKDRSRSYRRSRSRSRSRERFDREHSIDKKYIRRRSRTRSRSIERRFERHRSRSRSRSYSRSTSLSSISSEGSSDSRERPYKKKRGSKSRSSLEDSKSTYPTQPLESLSSGIPYQRQVSSDIYTPFTQTAPPYSQPQPNYPPPAPPYVHPPGMPQQLPYPAVPPRPLPPIGWQQQPPPYNYNVPPPTFMGPDQPPGVYPPPSYPPMSQPTIVPPDNIVPPGTQQPLPAPASTSSVTGSSKKTDTRSRTLQAVPIDNKSKESKKEPTKKKSSSSEDIVEKKTITIEKKTISITPTESNRTVLPPKSDTSKIAAEVEKKLAMQKPESTNKRPAESPKKVLTIKEKNKLIKEREARRKRIESLEEELSKLRKQQNEIMRKKRRQKDGHKDPVLLQNSKLQDEISVQIFKLRKASEETLKTLKESVVKDDDSGPPSAKKSKEMSGDDSSQKPVKKSTSPIESKETVKEVKKVEEKTRYEFFDPGGHHCKMCNLTSGSIYSVLQHLHGRKHQKNMNQYERPWVPEAMSNPPKLNLKIKAITLPVKGQEFLVPCKAYFCTLCKEFAGDEACADFHLKSESHYLKYEQKVMKEQNVIFEPKYKRTNSAKSEQDKSKTQKKQSPQEKLQAEKRVKEKEKKWEKPVAELEDVSEPQQKAGFDMFSAKGKASVELKKSKSEENHTENKDKETSKEKEEPSKESESKGKIAIHISNKTGIKPAPITGKMPGKKNPLLPPWTPVSKQSAPNKPNIFPLRKQTKVESAKPPSLDLFLTIGSGDDKSKPLPIMKGKLGDGKTKVTAQDILEAFSGKRKDDNPEPGIEENKEKPKMSKEEMEDMKMLGINPEEHKPMAEKKAPPPPSQNLSLPPGVQSNSSSNSLEDKKDTESVENLGKSASDLETKKKTVENTLETEQKTVDSTELSNTGLVKANSPSNSAKKEDSSIDSKVVDISSLSAEKPSAVVETVTVLNDSKTEQVNDDNVANISLSSGVSDRDASAVDKSETTLETVPVAEDVASDIDDLASDASGISMHMGSDFEVLDECEADEVEA